jgi:tetratricopeptide (TPR) repeat protein
MKRVECKAFRIAVLFLSIMVAGGGGCWQTDKPHSAHFDGVSAFGQESNPVELDVRALYGGDSDEQSCRALKDYCGKLDSVAVENRGRVCADIGITALFVNDAPLATEMLDHAVMTMEQITVGGEREKKVTSLDGSESEKLFKGEPHERVIVYLYRGALYMAEGDYENAQACFKNAAMQDAFAQEEQERANWLTVDVLQLVCKKLLRETDANDFELYMRQRYGPRIESVETALETEAPNLIVLVGVGEGPEKLATESHGQELAYAAKPSYVHSVHVVTKYGALAMMETDDVYIQAVTRGGRKMDEILGEKAQARKTIEAVGDAAAAMSPLVPGGAVLGLVKELSWSMSDGIDSSADSRQIMSIPGKLYLYVGHVEEATDVFKVRALASNKQVLAEKKIVAADLRPGPLVILGHAPY